MELVLLLATASLQVQVCPLASNLNAFTKQSISKLCWGHSTLFNAGKERDSYRPTDYWTVNGTLKLGHSTSM
jgi:hypothetical protein